MTMRIVGGSFKGRALQGPRTDAVRPTSDRLREALFNVLAHAHDDVCVNARVLDLFAGTGALALEAISRGAAFAVMVDEGTEARGIIRANVEALGVAAATRVFRRDATRLGLVGPNEPFNLMFCDPPYGRSLAELALASAAVGGWLAPGALVVVEERADAIIALPPSFTELDTRLYGETQMMIARFAAGTSSSPSPGPR